jgi:hypothetical protein
LKGKHIAIKLAFALLGLVFRYISIVYPVKISQMNRRKRLYLTFIVIWSLGFIIALPNLYLLKLHPFYNRPQYYICGLSDHSTDSNLITFYKYTESALFFFLPAFIQVSLLVISVNLSQTVTF